jgi:hypothetical protein
MVIIRTNKSGKPKAKSSLIPVYLELEPVGAPSQAYFSDVCMKLCLSCVKCFAVRNLAVRSCLKSCFPKSHQ